MKTCPQCGKSFPDEYLFCLSDGTPLNADRTIPYEEPTLIRHEEPTVVRPPANRRRSAASTILLFVLAGILTLALGAAIGVLYVFWPRQAAVEQTKANDASPTPTVNRQVTEPKQTSETNTRPQRTPTPAEEEDTPTQEEPPAPPDDEPVTDPGRTRISFRRGRAEETVSGNISSTRSFVLYAKNGQNLTARVRSDDRCVSFDGGSARLSQPTDDGDNVISIVNNCGEPARFSLSVSIR